MQAENYALLTDSDLFLCCQAKLCLLQNSPRELGGSLVHQPTVHWGLSFLGNHPPPGCVTGGI